MQVGTEIPSAKVAILDNGLPISFDIRDVLHGHRCLIVGAPQAFTPVCTTEHIPEIAADIDRYKELGFDRFIVLAPDNPWTMAAWKRYFPEADEFMFLSDGNLEFATECGLRQRWAGLYLGDCQKRYVIQTAETMIENIAVEDSILVVRRTSSANLLDMLTNAEAENLLEFVDA